MSTTSGFLSKVMVVMKELFRRYSDDKLPQVGATLAYFFLLSIFPFFIFLNALLGFLNISISQIIGDISHLAPQEVILLLEGYLNSVVNIKNTGLLSIGLLAAIFSASRAMNILISVLNTAYDVKEHRNIFRLQFLSILFTLTMGLAIATMLILPTLGRTIMTRIADFFHISLHLVDAWVIMRWVIVFAILFITIALLYHVGPAVKNPFSKAIPGTIFTSLAWSLISILFGIYVNNFNNYSAVYGSIGAVIILMIWFYLTGIIIMIGGELNQILFEMKSKGTEGEEVHRVSSETLLDNHFSDILELYREMKP